MFIRNKSGFRPMSLTVDDFDFPLPPELIAQHPAAERRGSRLLHVCPRGLPAVCCGEPENPAKTGIPIQGALRT